MPEATKLRNGKCAPQNGTATVSNGTSSPTASDQKEKAANGFCSKEGRRKRKMKKGRIKDQLFCRSTRVEDSHKSNGKEQVKKTETERGSEPNDNYIIDKSSNSYYRWVLIVTLAFSYNLLFNITRFVFDDLHHGMAWIPWLILDLVADLVYIADIAVKARTGFLEHGLLVRDSNRIRELYITSWEFSVDVLTVLPFDYLAMILLWKPYPAGRFFRLLRYPRAIDALERTETRSSYPNAFRVSCVVMYIIIIIHWNACFYFLLSQLLGLGSDSWVYGVLNEQSLPHGMKDTLLRRYIYSFYWSTLTLTTIGEVPGPVQNIEYVFVTIDLMWGVLIFATIVGNVGSMISNMSASRAEFQSKMDGVKKYMKVRKVDKTLEVRVIRWFDYLWSNKQSLNEENALKDCEAGLLAELVLKLQLQVFSPGDYICRKGDIGREMYIVKRGKLQVVSSDKEDAQIFATLQEGSVFGELSILNIRGSKNGNRRTANVRSVGYTDLFVLNKNDLWMALKEYPEARQMLLVKGRELLRKDNLLEENGGGERDSPEETIDELINTLNDLQRRVVRLKVDKISAEERLNNRIQCLEKELQKYEKAFIFCPNCIRHQTEPRFARRNTLAADFDPHDLIPQNLQTSRIDSSCPESKKEN